MKLTDTQKKQIEEDLAAFTNEYAGKTKEERKQKGQFFTPASLKQYNQYLLKRNEVLESLVKKYKKFLEDLQNKEEEEEHEKIY